MNPNNRKNRDTLKDYFKKGKTPTEDQFGELIDSTLNLVEDEPAGHSTPNKTAAWISAFIQKSPLPEQSLLCGQSPSPLKRNWS